MKKAEGKARKIFRIYHGFDPMEDIPFKLKNEGWTCEDVKRFFGIYRKTRKLCSNPFCCGNPRRMKGQINLTLQELRIPTVKEWEDYYEKNKDRIGHNKRF